MRKIVVATLVFCCITAMAADVVIQSLSKDGQLIFTGTPYMIEYHVEQSSSLAESWEPLLDIPATGMESGAITSSVPVTATTMFFRVVADRRPVPDGMVEIQAGTNTGTDGGPYSLTVETFCMDESEVTKFQWFEVYDWAVNHGYIFDNLGVGKDISHPIVRINWYDCVKWCNARSEKEGKDPCYRAEDGSVFKSGQSTPQCDFDANGYRLPTTIEWEYAARGGHSGKLFPWGGDTISHSQANYYSDADYPYDISPTRAYHPAFYYTSGFPYTSPLKYFPPNDYGLYDMAGNVSEWCNDSSASYRAVKGGNFWSRAYSAACSYSTFWGADREYYDCGFRSVCR